MSTIELPFAGMEGAEVGVDRGRLQVRQVGCRRVRVNTGVDRVASELQCIHSIRQLVFNGFVICGDM